MLRIAYMTGQYPRTAATFIQREVESLREHGVHVETIASRPPADRDYIVSEQQQERDNTYYLLPPRLELLRAHARLLFKSPRKYFSTLRLALRTSAPGMKAHIWQAFYFAEAALVADRIRRRGLTHLHNNFGDSSCSVAMLAASMGGFDFSFTVHSHEFLEATRWRLDEKIKRARFVVCISYYGRSQAMFNSSPSSWNRLRIVHCGVDVGMYRPRLHEGVGRRVLFVGRLAAVKGLPVLLEAIASLKTAHPDIELTIAGDGPDRKLIEDTIRRSGLEPQTKMLGYQSESQVRDLLAQADVFAMASFSEGIPVVLMEAMASGVPVVAPGIAGIPELIDEGRCGFMVPPGDAASLADRIGRFINDPELRSRFAAAGRLKVEQQFDLKTECDRFCGILRQELSAPHS